MDKIYHHTITNSKTRETIDNWVDNLPIDSLDKYLVFNSINNALDFFSRGNKMALDPQVLMDILDKEIEAGISHFCTPSRDYMNFMMLNNEVMKEIPAEYPNEGDSIYSLIYKSLYAHIERSKDRIDGILRDNFDALAREVEKINKTSGKREMPDMRNFVFGSGKRGSDIRGLSSILLPEGAVFAPGNKDEVPSWFKKFLDDDTEAEYDHHRDDNDVSGVFLWIDNLLSNNDSDNSDDLSDEDEYCDFRDYYGDDEECEACYYAEYDRALDREYEKEKELSESHYDINDVIDSAVKLFNRGYRGNF